METSYNLILSTNPEFFEKCYNKVFELLKKNKLCIINFSYSFLSGIHNVYDSLYFNEFKIIDDIVENKNRNIYTNLTTTTEYTIKDGINKFLEILFCQFACTTFELVDDKLDDYSDDAVIFVFHDLKIMVEPLHIELPFLFKCKDFEKIMQQEHDKDFKLESIYGLDQLIELKSNASKFKMVQCKCVFKAESIYDDISSARHREPLHMIVLDETKDIVDITLLVNDTEIKIPVKGTVYTLYKNKTDKNIFESYEFEHAYTSVEIAILYMSDWTLYFINKCETIESAEYFDVSSYNYYNEQALKFWWDEDNDNLDYNIDSYFCKGNFSIELSNNDKI